MGYRRNEVARSMRNMRSGQRTDDIGLMLGDLTNPFFAAVASAVIAEARSRGYAVVLASADEDPQAERELEAPAEQGHTEAPAEIEYVQHLDAVELIRPVHQSD